MPRPEAYELLRQFIQSIADDPSLLDLSLNDLRRRLKPFGHSLDYACARWNGVLHSFTPAQGSVVRLLWEAHEAGFPDVRGETLLAAAGSESDKIASLFKNHPCWGSMIVAGEARGSYRLASQEILNPPRVPPESPRCAPDG